jgi:hypothetical protein
VTPLAHSQLQRIDAKARPTASPAGQTTKGDRPPYTWANRRLLINAVEKSRWRQFQVGLTAES